MCGYRPTLGHLGYSQPKASANRHSQSSGHCGRGGRGGAAEACSGWRWTDTGTSAGSSYYSGAATADSTSNASATKPTPHAKGKIKLH
jgi:hypothetical protein